VIRIERRLRQPAWLTVAVPLGSLVAAFALSALVLLITGHDPIHTYRRLFDSAFIANGALSATVVSATPLAFTALAAAAAFRMNLFNIGGEGQLYMGAILAAAVAIATGGWPTAIVVVLMCVTGAIGGAVWALIPGVLRAFFATNEIITSLMLNYVAALILTYLIFDSESYWRDTSSFEARTFPQGKTFPDSARWPSFDVSGLVVPLGFVLVLACAAVLAFVYTRTRFGFEAAVIGDSPRAARYAGMRTRRKILSVMALSGALAGIGGASQDGDFRHLLDPRGLTQANYGYAGIVIAALARYNPFGAVLVALLLGGLQNAGYTLQGADFPAGLVGMMQGMILFCALGGELLVRYRIRVGRGAVAAPAEAAA